MRRALRLYYMPAYAWSRSPVETMVQSCHVQTRMAALGFPDAMLCLLPGTDRGSLGFVGGAIQNDLLLGPDATPVLLTVLPGDWWNAYRFAVDEVYGFREPQQTVPVSEMQYGISRYLLRDDVWEPTLGTMKSWPQRDAANDGVRLLRCVQSLRRAVFDSVLLGPFRDERRSARAASVAAASPTGCAGPACGWRKARRGAHSSAVSGFPMRNRSSWTNGAARRHPRRF